MKCDNYCPHCRELEEYVTHVIFECPPALLAWSLSATPTSPNIFRLPSIYTNMNYLFQKKNIIVELDLIQIGILILVSSGIFGRPEMTNFLGGQTRIHQSLFTMQRVRVKPGSMQMRWSQQLYKITVLRNHKS